MRSYFSSPNFVLGPVRPKPSSIAAWLQLTVIEYLEARARPEVVWLPIAHDGSEPETPDLMFVIPRRQACFMTFLAPEQQAVPDQLSLQQRLEAAGAGYALIRDEPSALQALSDWEVLKTVPGTGGSPLYQEPPVITPEKAAGENDAPANPADAGLSDEPPRLSRLLTVTALASSVHAASGLKGAGGGA